MELRSFDLKLTELPRIIEVKVPTGATESDLKQMIEDLKAQVAYNSRFEDSDSREPEIELLGRAGDIVQLKVL